MQTICIIHSIIDRNSLFFAVLCALFCFFLYFDGFIEKDMFFEKVDEFLYKYCFVGSNFDDFDKFVHTAGYVGIWKTKVVYVCYFSSKMELSW